MNDDCVTVDELTLEIADYTNNYQEVAGEKLKRLCPQSCKTYNYLQDRCTEPSARCAVTYTNTLTRVS